MKEFRKMREKKRKELKKVWWKWRGWRRKIIMKDWKISRLW